MTKSRLTINKEILIEQSRDVIDVIMKIGGGLMPRTMLVEISDLPQYKDRKLLTQLKSLTRPQRHVMRNNTIKEYPPFLTSTRLDNYVIYTVSLANARLINPGQSYAEPSLEASALVRRLQQIYHRINILREHPKWTYDQLSTIDSGFLTKRSLPQYLSNLAKHIGSNVDRLLMAEIKYTQNTLDRMAGGRKGNLPDKIQRDNAFVTLKLPTILALHQMGVYIQLIGRDSYSVYIYEGRKLREVNDIVKLINDAVAYFNLLLPSSYHCERVLIRTVNYDDISRVKRWINMRRVEIQNIKGANGIGGIKGGTTNVLEDYFGGIML